jgi:hypothetical protein
VDGKVDAPTGVRSPGGRDQYNVADDTVPVVALAAEVWTVPKSSSWNM